MREDIKLSDIDINIEDIPDVDIPHTPIMRKVKGGVEMFFGWKKEGDKWVRIVEFVPINNTLRKT